MQKATTNNENPAIGNVLLAEVPKVQGTIMVDFTVQCPHCDENICQSMDREWFEETMGHSFPTYGVDGDYEAESPIRSTKVELSKMFNRSTSAAILYSTC